MSSSSSSNPRTVLGERGSPATRIALVGCGAVSARSWVPALRQIGSVEVIACVDRERGRAEELASRLPGCRVETDWGAVVGDVDLAILALPHHLHATAGAAFLDHGRHVLMEKPLARSSAEVAHLLEASASGGGRLFVAQVRRLFPGYRFIREVLRAGLLGRLKKVSVEEGGVFGWPIASDAQLRAESAGGGVLLDTGAHVVDALLWWLGQLEVSACRDDAEGGIEAESEVTFRFDGGTGSLRLSRLRSLSNTARFEGEKASLTADVFGRWGRLQVDGGTVSMKGEFELPGHEAGTVALFREQLEAVRRALATGKDAWAVPAEEAAATVAFVEECYRLRTPWLEPWRMAADIGGQA